ncbi:hypothetical protein SLS58_002898 [Diplodia intermedia]|uniref:Uncharacterized protein n=1 Tax=Diplodia intermedia TaxID=856260 RepID=A0ABR3TXY0_9PEZI
MTMIASSRFEVHNLIFVPSRKAWYPPSSCAWVDDKTQLSKPVPIRTPYQSLEEFFTQALNVEKRGLELYIRGLEQLSRQNPPSPFEIKQSIRFISTMVLFANDLRNLHSANILPVKLPGGNVKVVNASEDFAIVDRKEHREAFKDKAITLDFSLNEVHACRPFLLAMGLDGKFTSAAVKEKTTVQAGVPELGLTNTLREKAHAFLRVVVHFKHWEYDQSIFDRLRHAAVYVSESISKSMSLTQNQRVITVDSEQASFHLEECDGQLKLFVRPDRCSTELCYLQELPNRLLRFLSISDPTAEALLVKILAASSLEIADAILDDAGIIELDKTQDTTHDTVLRAVSDHTEDLGESDLFHTPPASPSSWHSTSVPAESGNNLPTAKPQQRIPHENGGSKQSLSSLPLYPDLSLSIASSRSESIDRLATDLGNLKVDTCNDSNTTSAAT